MDCELSLDGLFSSCCCEVSHDYLSFVSVGTLSARLSKKGIVQLLIPRKLSWDMVSASSLKTTAAFSVGIIQAPKSNAHLKTI